MTKTYVNTILDHVLVPNIRDLFNLGERKAMEHIFYHGWFAVNSALSDHNFPGLLHTDGPGPIKN